MRTGWTRGWPVVLAVAGVVGCAIEIPTQGPPDRPLLVEQRNAKIAVYFTAPVRASRYSGIVVNVPFGETSVARLTQAFHALFSSVEVTPAWPPWRQLPPAVDGVIEVDEGSVNVAMGNDATAPDRVTVTYHACLFRPDGSQLSCWTAQSQAEHQRKTVDLFRGGIRGSVSEIVDQATADAVASLIHQIQTDPAVTAMWSDRSVHEAKSGAAVGVAILRWPMRRPGHDAAAVEACLAQNIAEDMPGIQIIEQKRIRTALYPRLEASAQPADTTQFGEMVANPQVRDALMAVGVGYLVAFSTEREQGPVKGLPICGYQGCIGYVWNSESSRIEAGVWDVSRAAITSSVESEVKGTNAVPMLFLPIPIRAQTLDEACEQLGHKIAAAIRATMAAPSDPPGPVRDSPRGP